MTLDGDEGKDDDDSDSVMTLVAGVTLSEAFD